MELINKAIEALNNSYSPYSNFKVGAAVLTKNNKIFTGTNIENVSFGLTICAERVALYKAISEGYKKNDIVKIAIVGNTNEIIFPCGACRQVMLELMSNDAIVILSDKNKNIKEYKLEDLIPYSFRELL